MKNRAVAEALASGDTDNTRVHSYLLGYEHLFSNEQYFGLQVGNRHYHGEDAVKQNNDFSEARLSARTNLSEKTYVQGTLSQLDGQAWSPLLHNLLLVSKPNKTWRVELSSNRDVIETASAIAAQLSVQTYSASVDYVMNEHNMLVVGVYQQDISDGNKRIGGVLQYVYKPAWFKHGWFKLRAKQRNADFNPSEYFSPQEFKQYHLLAGYETRLDQGNSLRVRAHIGLGRQYIDGVGERAYEYLVGLRGWIRKFNYLDAVYYCTSDGGADNYRYCSGKLVWNYLW